MSNCPKCNSPQTAVKDSRPFIHLETIITRRRRLCLFCKFRFITYEISAQHLDEAGFVVNGARSLKGMHKLIRLMKEIIKTTEPEKKDAIH